MDSYILPSNSWRTLSGSQEGCHTIHQSISSISCEHCISTHSIDTLSSHFAPGSPIFKISYIVFIFSTVGRDWTGDPQDMNLLLYHWATTVFICGQGGTWTPLLQGQYDNLCSDWIYSPAPLPAQVCCGKRNRTSIWTCDATRPTIRRYHRKLLSHKVSLAAPPSFDYRVQTYQKHHTINASVPWALCGFVPYPGIGPGYSQIHSGQLVCLHHLMTASYYQGLLHRYVISLVFSILQPFHMAKASKCFEPARKPQLVLCVRPIVVDTGGIWTPSFTLPEWRAPRLHYPAHNKIESCKLPSAEVTDSNGPRTSVPGHLCIQYWWQFCLCGVHWIRT